MSIKTILVAVTADAASRGAIQSAFLLARTFGGHVEGLQVPPKRNQATAEAIMMSRESLRLADVDTRQILEDAEREGLGETPQARRLFMEVAEAMAVPLTETPHPMDGVSASFEVAASDDPEAIAAHGRVFDLIVVEQPRNDPDHALRKILRGFLFASGRPVLVATPHAPASLGDSILIAWNGSALSARAAAIARQYFRQARKVGILTVATGQNQQPTAYDLAAQLAWHGMDAEVVRAELGNRRLGDVFLEQAADFGADLLVMGTYAQSRFRETLTGGVTNHILSHAELPVLMVH